MRTQLAPRSNGGLDSSGWAKRGPRTSSQLTRQQIFPWQGRRGNPELIEDDMKDIRAECDQYYPDNIFNVDDTGLFCRLFFKRSYIHTRERRKTAGGTKGIKAKDRLSA